MKICKLITIKDHKIAVYGSDYELCASRWAEKEFDSCLCFVSTDKYQLEDGTKVKVEDIDDIFLA